MRKCSDIALQLRNGIHIYSFMKIRRSNDGSVLCVFSSLPQSTKMLSQEIQLKKQPENVLTPVVLTSAARKESLSTTTYVTYHTTGQVNYHNMSFSPMYMEPLYSITRNNPFFILSFYASELCKKENEIGRSDNGNKVVFDVTETAEIRMDLILSIAPCEAQVQENEANFISLSYDSIFRVKLEVVRDEGTFNFGKVFERGDCVKMKPNVDLFSERTSTPSTAYIKYYHRLYETDSLIVLAPNGEGVIKVVFCVEMRRPPWIKILFENNDFEAVLVEKSTVEIKLKVFCRTRKAYVKTSEEIKIVGVELDAEIYDDESTVPAGFM